MVVRNPIDEITEALHALPTDKLASVKDFVDFLKSHANPLAEVDDSDKWTEEDMRDFRTASARYGETVAPWDEVVSQSTSPTQEAKQ